MPGAYRRKSDQIRGARGRYTAWWTSADGKRCSCAAFTDKASSVRLAIERQNAEDQIRLGLVDRREVASKAAARLPIATHVLDYKLYLTDKDDTARHVSHTAGVITRLCTSAGITHLPQLRQEPVQAALRRVRDSRSARTANFARQAFLAWLRWLAGTGRLAEVPRWTHGIRPYHEASDRRRVRRVLTSEELARLLSCTERGPPVLSYGATRSKTRSRELTGWDRVLLYRVAMETGFRAGELRSLTPESFDLAGCTIRCASAYTKSRREAIQPIRHGLTVVLGVWLMSKPPGEPVWALPWDTGEMFRRDLERAGIAYQTAEGVVDFHALRHGFISGLIEAGVDPRTVQELARHSTITLTIDRYSHSSEQRKREAIEHNPKGE